MYSKVKIMIYMSDSGKGILLNINYNGIQALYYKECLLINMNNNDVHIMYMSDGWCIFLEMMIYI